MVKKEEMDAALEAAFRELKYTIEDDTNTLDVRLKAADLLLQHNYLMFDPDEEGGLDFICWNCNRLFVVHLEESESQPNYCPYCGLRQEEPKSIIPPPSPEADDALGVGGRREKFLNDQMQDISQTHLPEGQIGRKLGADWSLSKPSDQDDDDWPF